MRVSWCEPFNIDSNRQRLDAKDPRLTAKGITYTCASTGCSFKWIPMRLAVSLATVSYEGDIWFLPSCIYMHIHTHTQIGVDVWVCLHANCNMCRRKRIHQSSSVDVRIIWNKLQHVKVTVSISRSSFVYSIVVRSVLMFLLEIAFTPCSLMEAKRHECEYICHNATQCL